MHLTKAGKTMIFLAKPQVFWMKRMLYSTEVQTLKKRAAATLDECGIWT